MLTDTRLHSHMFASLILLVALIPNCSEQLEKATSALWDDGSFEEVQLDNGSDPRLTYVARRSPIQVTVGRDKLTIDNRDDAIGYPRLSNDGSTIAYITPTEPRFTDIQLGEVGEDVYGAVWLMDRDGTHRRPLLNGADIRHPAPRTWTTGGKPQPLPRNRSRLGAVFFGADDRTVYVNREGLTSADVYAIDVATGQHELLMKDRRIVNVIRTEGRYKGYLQVSKIGMCCHLVDPTGTDLRAHLVMVTWRRHDKTFRTLVER